MQRSPFALFRSLTHLLDLVLLTREDNVATDPDTARLIQNDRIVSLKQKHGNRCVRVSQPSSRLLEADGLFTDVPDLTLTIRFADCQNLVIAAPEKRVIGLVHAGWRGVQSKAVTSAYDLLKKEWDIDPAETFVGLGPSLCKACADFTDPAREVPGLAAFIDGQCIDLMGALDAELATIGVPQNHIERLPDCTRCHPELYWTYRGGHREQVQAGYTNVLAVTLR